MIGTLLNIEAGVFDKLLTYYLPIAVIALLAGGLIGWWLGQRVRHSAQRTLYAVDVQHSWLYYSPLTPLLFLAAVALPFASLPFVAAAIVLALLVLPTVFVTAARFYTIREINEIEGPVTARILSEVGWRDTALVVLAYLFSGFIAAGAVPDEFDYVVEYLGYLPLGLLFGAVLGVGLGVLFGAIRNRLAAYLERRHNRGLYSSIIDNSVGTIQMVIEAVLTQFHATPLTGVLIISAAGLPFTSLSQKAMLPLILFAPVMSAVVASILVDNPSPDQPGRWQHWRTGLWGVAQIGIGYMVGALMLSPLALVHEWMLAEPDQVIEALKTHLDLTFTALGYSLLIGGIGGVLASRLAALRTVLINVGNVGRTIPSLAVLALALPIFGVGRAPSLIALIFIGALPILVNTSVGIIEVSRDIKESARGMGMNDFQVLVRVEIPIAMPVIMAGIRTSAVLVVASAVLAGFIGGGGLGDLIVRGDGSGRDDILLTGAILATVLAIFLEYFFGWLETLLTPRGLREA